MIGGFGKIPAKPDFIRVGHSDATTRAFETWLDESCLRLRESSMELPDSPVRFVMRPEGAPHACVGVLRPSRDAVGRRFPLALFHLLDWGVVRSRWSGLPFATDPFLESADQVLHDAARFDVETLRSRTNTLWTPTGEDLAATDGICRRVLDQTPWQSVSERLFQAQPGERAAYAFRTALAACQRSAGQPIAIDCPIEVDVDLFFWLELARRFARTETIAFVWLEDPRPRLMVAMGAPSYSLLAAIAAPSHESQSIWPLTTTRAPALEAAGAAMAPVLEPINDATSSLESLFETLSRASYS